MTTRWRSRRRFCTRIKFVTSLTSSLTRAQPDERVELGEQLVERPGRLERLGSVASIRALARTLQASAMAWLCERG